MNIQNCGNPQPTKRRLNIQRVVMWIVELRIIACFFPVHFHRLHRGGNVAHTCVAGCAPMLHCHVIGLLRFYSSMPCKDYQFLLLLFPELVQTLLQLVWCLCWNLNSMPWSNLITGRSHVGTYTASVHVSIVTVDWTISNAEEMI